MLEFSEISKARLATCDQRLQDVMNEVIKTENIAIICGHRDQQAQDQAFADGFSKLKWPNGPHNALPSLAVDVMRYPVDWNDVAGQESLAVVVKAAAAKLGIDIDCGADWTQFVDRDHFQVKGIAC